MCPYRFACSVWRRLCRPRLPQRQAGASARADSLRQLAESLVVLSTAHLSATTLQRLHADTLSINAYVHRYGAFLHLGCPPEVLPDETDLRHIVEMAAQADIAWLGFDIEGPVADGLPLFRNPAEETFQGMS